MYFGVARQSAAERINGAVQLRLHDRDGYEFVDAVFNDRSPELHNASAVADAQRRRERSDPNSATAIDQIIEALRKAREGTGGAGFDVALFPISPRRGSNKPAQGNALVVLHKLPTPLGLSQW